MIKRYTCIVILFVLSILIISCGNLAYGTVSGTVSGAPAGSAVRVIATNEAVNLYESDSVTTRSEGVLDDNGTFT